MPTDAWYKQNAIEPPTTVSPTPQKSMEKKPVGKAAKANVSLPNPMAQNPFTMMPNPLLNVYGGSNQGPYGPNPVPNWAANFADPMTQNPLAMKNPLINPWGGAGLSPSDYGPKPIQANINPWGGSGSKPYGPFRTDAKKVVQPVQNMPVGFGSQTFPTANGEMGTAPYTYFMNTPGDYAAYAQTTPAAGTGYASKLPAKTWWGGGGGGGGGGGYSSSAYDSWVNAMARWNID
jgi:hypothetical protein